MAWAGSLVERTGVTCKFCGSLRVVRNGRKKQGQYWLCSACGRGFMDNHALPRMRYGIEDVAAVLSFFYTGTPLSMIKRDLRWCDGCSPSYSTLYGWVMKFTRQAEQVVETNRPHPGGRWLAIETETRILRDTLWFWDVIDMDSRFLLATCLTQRRSVDDVQGLLAMAVSSGGKRPCTILTSQPLLLQAASEACFEGRPAYESSRDIHEQEYRRASVRAQADFVQRSLVLRGLKAREAARLVSTGWGITYNYFRAHPDLGGRTPSQVAGIRFECANWKEFVVAQLPTKALLMSV